MQQKYVIVIALAVLITTIVSGVATAQDNSVIDVILAEDQLTYQNAAYLLLSADGILKEDADANVAYRAIEEGPENLSSVNYSIGGTSFSSRGYLQSGFGYPPDQSLTLGEYSLLVMETFDIPGGAMYTLTRWPRYAARELAFRDIVQGEAYPRMKLSGERALRIVGRVLTLQERGTLR